ncbi:hypothetical protein ACX1C1_01900 [Paenibacillus sp. strain BS8-2]
MKVILFITLILSGMMSGGSGASEVKSNDIPVHQLETEYVQLVAPDIQVSVLSNGETLQPADEGDEPVITVTGDAGPILLQSVEELTLYDDRAAVIGKLGEPKGVTQDEFYSELVIYEYERLHVVFFGEYIQSIDIAADVKEVLLDDRYVEATLTDLKDVLGDPDYVAEDGIVFQRDEALLKLFVDQASGELSSISYYHLATV